MIFETAAQVRLCLNNRPQIFCLGIPLCISIADTKIYVEVKEGGWLSL